METLVSLQDQLHEFKADFEGRKGTPRGGRRNAPGDRGAGRLVTRRSAIIVGADLGVGAMAPQGTVWQNRE
jgi:hypothetical protein